LKLIAIIAQNRRLAPFGKLIDQLADEAGQFSTTTAEERRQ